MYNLDWVQWIGVILLFCFYGIPALAIWLITIVAVFKKIASSEDSWIYGLLFFCAMIPMLNIGVFIYLWSELSKMDAENKQDKKEKKESKKPFFHGM